MLTLIKADPGLDRRGYARSPITLPAYRQGKPAQNKGRKFPPEPLSKREMLALLDACGGGREDYASPFAPRAACPAARRNRALIVVLWRSGLRISEALALHPHHVDLEQGAIRILHGKGDQARTVGLDRGGAMFVHEWLLERQELRLSPALPLFCVIEGPTRGQAVHAAYMRQLLKDLAVKARIFKRVHPHGLRHTNAFELGEEGVPVHYIRRHLGHSTLAITARYMDHVHPGDVVQRIREREWPVLAA